MINYLLHATIIWLLGLLTFDLALRRESSHAANRCWLLGFLLAGLLLPLWSWHQPFSESGTYLHRPLQTLDETQQIVVRNMTPAQARPGTIGAGTVFLIVYALGLSLCLFRMLRELVVLLRWYHQGSKSKTGDWTIVETGQQHGPFSLLRCIFVTGRSQYTTAQWEMILQHEQMHSRLLHFADLLLLQLLQLLLWFHPLVYSYRKRLLLVHEYQADARSSASPVAYGQFLVEQSLLLHGPALSHSFNRSPIKNRIFMLTQRNSSLVNRLKYLLVFPVLAGSILCCGQVVSQTGNGREWKGNKVTYKGNVFAFNTPRADTVITLNPVTGKEAMMVTHPDSYPEQMNGHKIYNAQSVDQMPRYRNGTLNEALFQVVQKDLDQLKDGEYTLKISDIVIDQSGKLVYYNKPDLFSKPGSTQPSPQVLQQVAAKIEAYLDRNPEFDPALLNGQPAIVTTAFEQRVIVKDHRAMPYNDQQ